MRTIVLRLSLTLLVLSAVVDSRSLAGSGCGPKCPPRWSAPSPILDAPCHHKTYGYPFATCTCHRAYSSPHILGYSGMGCCHGYQKMSCICPLAWQGGERCWAPAYCNNSVEGGCQEAGVEGDHSNWQVAFSGWENLGHIPNDSAAAAVEVSSGVGGGGSILESIRSNLPLP